MFTLERFPEDPTLTMVGIFSTLCFHIFLKFCFEKFKVFFLPDESNDGISQYANVLDVAFLVFPPYCLGKGFVDLTYKYVMQVIFESMGIKANG